VKVHPRESTSHYRNLLARLDAQDAIVVHDVDLNALLQASALLITGFSTVALEAMVYKCPVLIVNLTGEPDPVDYVSSGAALGAYTPDEIVTQMTRLLAETQASTALATARQEYLLDQLYRIDGQASQRVADLIQKMSRTQPC
jgi:CDP-glycerol glycerophosphotransferase (TagB/SpsB family)